MCSSISETYEYDYLGNRTSKTSSGVTTEYTTDLSSGYSQVLKATDGNTTVYYTRGFELISRREGSTASYYVYDGGLSVRALTNEAGTVTDTLVFDAFGNETGRTGTTDNSYGFQGEEQDSTGLYYLRARYMDPATGTFTTMDTYGGSLSDPMSLHKYLFANSNPVMYSDPSGHFSLAEMDLSMAIDRILDSAIMSGILYCVDANATDPEHEHHDIFGYFGAIGLGIIFGAVAIMLSSTIIGLLVLTIIGTILGTTGIIKGIFDIKDGYIFYGLIEIFASLFFIWLGWGSFAGALNAGKSGELIQLEAERNASGEGNWDNVDQEIDDWFKGHGTQETNKSSGSIDYRKVFFDQNPEVKGKVVVHHAVEQQVLNKPQTKDLFTYEEINSIEYLRGVPKDINSDLHLSKIRREWNRFYKENPNPTRQQILDKAAQIDVKYGHLFNPPLI